MPLVSKMHRDVKIQLVPLSHFDTLSHILSHHPVLPCVRLRMQVPMDEFNWAFSFHSAILCFSNCRILVYQPVGTQIFVCQVVGTQIFVFLNGWLSCGSQNAAAWSFILQLVSYVIIIEGFYQWGYVMSARLLLCRTNSSTRCRSEACWHSILLCTVRCCLSHGNVWNRRRWRTGNAVTPYWPVRWFRICWKVWSSWLYSWRTMPEVIQFITLYQWHDTSL